MTGPSVPLRKLLSRLRAAWPCWLPALLVLLLYLPALWGDFVWDDPLFLVEAPAYRAPDGWLAALARPFVLSPNYYRPLPLLTFVAELRLFGLQPFSFHLVNLLLHSLNALLVALLARRMFPRQAVWAPLAAGLVYGLHPALVETVAFISGRFDLMLTAFCLLALLADLRWRDRPWAQAAGVGLAFLGAALSKEMAVSLAALLPAYHLATARSGDRRPWAVLWARWRVYAAVLVAGLAYLLVRWLALGALYQPGQGNSLPVGTVVEHGLLVLQSLGEYVLIAVWPFTTLTPIHYSVLPVTLETVRIPSVALALLALVGAGVALRKAQRLGWLGVAGLVALLPVVNILPLELSGGSFVAERFITLPLVFPALAMGGLAGRAAGRRWACGALAVWLAGSALVVWLTVPHWQSEEGLWRWAMRRAPESSLPYINLSKVVSESGDPAEGLVLADEALARDPESSNAWNQRGLALFFLGRYEEAEAAFRHALELEEEQPLYWNNLAGALREQGRLVEAVTILHEEVLTRGFPAGHLGLGLVYLAADRPDLAAQHLSEAVRLLPPGQAAEAQGLLEQTRDPVRWLRLGNLLLANGEPEGALRAFEEAERLGAGPLEARLGGAAALEAMERWEEAEALLRSLLPQNGEDPRLLNLLGVALQAQGLRQEACSLFRQAAQLAPDWPEPGENLARGGCAGE